MKTIVHIALAAGTALVGSTISHAQENSSWGLIGGYSRGVEASSSVTETFNLGGTTAAFNIAGESVDPAGYLVGVNYHMPLDTQWRFEAEISYRHTKADIEAQISGTAGGVTEMLPANGEANVNSLAAMANLWRYTGDPDADHRFFFGGGLGLSRNAADGAIYSQGTLLGATINNTTSLDESTTSLAWQLGAGWDFAMSETTRGSISYRYFDSGDVDNLETATHSIVFGIDF
jgi:opacity protein-like surface antigen